ncbi:cyclopropane-fatty-acyl-phospholipid synthase [Candidatus Kaiserbacteria bacterium RIFCSPHIGHO2_01_FULL_51_33]|uniref:Cyclopropane-fatty-acyl-phospholipid synthase n=1 Tax=Candidatus Kaiserbacteria bacterium RIFCSPLOWO2_01_FULL_51_21 TaxID=1798508 RepID=A0A1F6ED77_9BACT|nr:MAG: cyclopropane-fatty-acyl-phospholipid synthase [Candidatus Kaiserbacteria bacterium RIFCSPHIGHO2_01_FULL_51_33]OGG71550.1 MAG: cyclopropane-fatty-acyl-phospholipid synthase [Candidatus Kaiserbacteria bacterium RIFCSPLOWO2_01_FULL_51_21]
MQGPFERQAKTMLRKAGIEVGGTRPYDIAVHDSRLYRRALLHGSRGLGEAYMDGWWDCEALDELFYRIRAQRKESKDPRRMALWFTSKVSNLQSIELSREVAERHYDRGNDLFIAMLDRRLTYTCGYWKEAANLNEAQENKLKLVCDKLALRAGQRVLDIGCGFGSFAKYAAEQYGVSVVGVTISKEQVVLGRKLCAGLPVELCLLDYREVREKYPEPFDHIVSLGMFEHVGRKNHALFMGEVATLLKDEGLFFLQSIGGSGGINPWINKYVFPGGQIPSAEHIVQAAGRRFIIEDWHNFGADYDTTLMAWHRNFVEAWEKLQSSYDERFKRMWCYFLLSCAGSFRARRNQLWQIVFSKHGVPGGYRSIR